MYLLRILSGNPCQLVSKVIQYTLVTHTVTTNKLETIHCIQGNKYVFCKSKT
jgi:hypothetical protein